jgi:hypothetical protein
MKQEKPVWLNRMGLISRCPALTPSSERWSPETVILVDRVSLEREKSRTKLNSLYAVPSASDVIDNRQLSGSNQEQIRNDSGLAMLAKVASNREV